ncbi:MAG: hypothetical protein P4L79_13840 [Legionella sp.]|nr:hypothetical protein [Legionella sp.]
MISFSDGIKLNQFEYFTTYAYALFIHGEKLKHFLGMMYEQKPTYLT